MYNGPIKNHLNMGCAALTPGTLQKAIVLSGLTWGVPPAQYFAMQCWGLMDPVAVVTKHTKDEVRTELKGNNDTLLGLPICLDEGLPPSTIQLKYKGAPLFEIQNLAIPCHF